MQVYMLFHSHEVVIDKCLRDWNVTPFSTLKSGCPCIRFECLNPDVMIYSREGVWDIFR